MEMTRRPVVLHVAAVEYTATRLLVPQLRALRQRGYDARVACAPDGSDFDPGLSPFSPVRLSFPRSPEPRAMLGACRELLGIVRELRPDVVHLHTPAAALPTRMIPRRVMPRGTRIVYTVHGFAHVWDRAGLRDHVLQQAERVLAGRTDLMLFQSREDLAQSQARGYRTRLRYLGNGVEESWFAIPPSPAISSPARLLFVGRLIREKGVLDLMEALASVPGVRLTVVGAELTTDRDGVEAEARRRAAQPPLAGRVTFTGAVDKAAMHRLVAEADALVLPSYREGVPRSLIEGFAAGRPAVATDVRGCRELVEDGVTGLLVPPRRPAALAAALRRLAGLTPSGYRALSGAARELASTQYREATVFDRLCEAYTELGVPLPSSPLRAAVVGDDLGPGQRLAGTTPQEEHGGGAVEGVGRVRDPVEEAQPEEQGAGDPAQGAGPGDSPHEVVQGPQRGGARTRGRARVDLLEGPEEVPMPARGEAGEVVGAGMHLLHERGLGVDQAVLGQDPVDLVDHASGVEDVLEDGLHDDRVHAAGGERDVVGVGDQLGDVAAVEVEPDHLDVATGGVQGGQAVADRAAADDQHPCRPPGQQGQEAGDVALGDPVQGLPDAPH
jgi:glycosyltransferase involved in cell wall biosynthesis